MHKELMILGLLQRKPMHGYDLYRIIHMHGVLFAELKKANLYYLLTKLEKQGCIIATIEKHTKGARRERVSYTITNAGRERFLAQLRESTADHTTNAVSTALVFLPNLPFNEAVSLLEQRQQRLLERLEKFKKEVGDIKKQPPLSQLATIRLLDHIHLELHWTENTIKKLALIKW